MVVLGQYGAALVVTWWYMVRTDKQQQKSDDGRINGQTDRISSIREAVMREKCSFF